MKMIQEQGPGRRYFNAIVFFSCKNAKNAVEATDSRVVPEIFPNSLCPFLRSRAAGQYARWRQEGVVVRAFRRAIRGTANGTSSR